MSKKIRDPLYISLRNRSDYSLLKSPMSISSLVSRAKSLQFPAIALTDENNLFGAIEFSSKCVKNEIQPIIGCELKLIDNPQDNISSTISIILYAKTEIGYKNLMWLNTQSYLNQGDLYQKITLEELKTHAKDLICLFDFQNDLSIPNIADSFTTLKSIFQTDFSAEIFRTPVRNIDYQKKEIELKKIAYSYSVPLVATNDVFFSQLDDYKSYQVLRCVDTAEYISNFEDAKVTENNYLKNEQEMLELFKDIPVALKNTVTIARKCSFFPQRRQTIFPKFLCNRSETNELEFQAKIGLIKLFLKKNITNLAQYQNIDLINEIDEINQILEKIVPENYVKQLEYELSVILNVGFAGYFLIVADFISWAKNHDIPVGPGRGSGAGSVIAWSLGITTIDPIRFSLFFERFLNPDRISLPDFDIDFCQDRRNEVIEYVKSKYGYDSVASIITFGKLQAKAVLRDVGRVMQFPYSLIDNIIQFIPFSAVQAVTLDEAIQKEEKLQIMQKEDHRIKELFDVSLKLEGVHRHISVHAAGTVISPEPLVNLIPLYRENDSEDIITQFHMYGVEESGLIKFDFLGLKTITVIKKATTLIKQNYGVIIDIDNINLDDEPTFQMLRNKRTLGVFQLEGAGVSDVLEQLKIDKFEQIIALISLYRPGPIENIPHYINCKNGKAEVTYAYDCLEPILKETYGIPVYQEQVMQIAQILAGYSMSQADLLRRAMGKKLPEEMKKHQNIFIEEVFKRHGESKEKASALFDKIAKFSGYAFNKAHATSYAMISYQTAYLKANYPVEFLTALMTYEINNAEKIAHIIQEAKIFEIDVLPPSINDSFAKFSIEKYINSIENTNSNSANTDQKHNNSSTESEKININHDNKYNFDNSSTIDISNIESATQNNLSSLIINNNNNSSNDNKVLNITSATNQINDDVLTQKPINEKNISSNENGIIENHHICSQNSNSISYHTNAKKNYAIRYGLSGIKGLGENCIEAMIIEREKNGKYLSIYDMIKRIPSKSLNKKQIENLIAAGAFDSLHQNRGEIYESSKSILDTISGPMLFSNEDLLQTSSTWTTEQKMQKEFEALGFYLSAHPIKTYENYIKHIMALNTVNIFTQGIKQGKIVATLISINKKMNKMREKYAFLTISDNYGMCEITIFPKQMKEYELIMEEGQNYEFTVSCRDQNGTISLSCISISPLLQEILYKISSVTISIKHTDDITNTQQMLLKYKNQENIRPSTNIKLFAEIHEEKMKLRFKLQDNLTMCTNLLTDLYEINAKLEWK